MATTFDGLLGNIFGGEDQGLSDYLTPEQVSRMNTQGLMAIASSLLKSSGRSPVPISFGQALGGAYEAGQRGYESAQQGALAQLLTKQKLDEQKQNQFLKTDILNNPSNYGLTDQQAKIVATAPASLLSEVLKRQLEPTKVKTVGEPYLASDGTYRIRTETGGSIPMSAEEAPKPIPVGTPSSVFDPIQNKNVLGQRMSDGSFVTDSRFGPARVLKPVDTGGGVVFVDESAMQPGTRIGKTLAPTVVGSAEGGYFAVGGGGGGANLPRSAMPAAPAVTPENVPRRPQAAQVAGPVPLIPGVPKPPFGNEKDLRAEFQAQAKPFNELSQAYQKIETAATNNSPAGDIALVYGFMKVLDPGSVVREGEFATAQNAGGVSDTVRNMYNKALSGERLGERTRSDFLQQSRNIIESQRPLAQDLVSRYSDIATQYQLNPNQVVYDPFKRIETADQRLRRLGGGAAPASASSNPVTRYNLTPRP